MTAEIIPFPTAEPGNTPDCRNCGNARFGSTTFCTLVGESILDEAATAAECSTFDPMES